MISSTTQFKLAQVRLSGYQLWMRSKNILIIFIVVFCFLAYFNTRYLLGRNGAISNCLHTHYFLVDTWDKNLNKGDIAAFYQQNKNPFFETGQKWIKMVAAVNNDSVRVNPNSIVINDRKKYQLRTQYILGKLKRDFDSLKTKWIIPKEQYFFIGQSNTSFDSRFWGTVKRQDIIGKAYAVF